MCRNMQLRPMEIALIGDSLSTDFHAGSIPFMLWKSHFLGNGNWFSETHGEIRSIFTRFNERTPVVALHLARVAARVNHPREPTNFFKRLAGVVPFSDQLDYLLKRHRLPRAIFLWIGHNNVDWVRRLSPRQSQDEVIRRVAFRLRINYKLHLQTLLERADRDGNETSIFVFGLINFSAFFQARQIMESIRRKDPRSYPFLESAFRTFPSMKPDYREQMIALAEMMNLHLASVTQEFRSRPNAHAAVKLIYSDAFATAELNDPKFYSKWDAWHPSIQGHKALAQAAWNVVLQHLPF
jgi:lysophospholipase L1-like esterase